MRNVSPQAALDSDLAAEHYRALVENLTEYAIITLDPDGFIRSWNKGAERLLGWTKEEAIGMSGSLFFTDQDISRREDRNELEEADRFGRSEDERWHVRKNGSLFWAQGAVMPMRVDTELIGYIKIFRDRTEKKEYEMRKDEFVIRASHELRTPLSIVKVNAEFLLAFMERVRQEDIKEALENINEQTDRLAKLIGEMLDLSKILAGKVAPRKEPFPVRALIEEVARSFSPASGGKRIKLLPGDDAVVHADRSQISQVLLNLIGNAIKYAPTGGPIEIHTQLQGGIILGQVRDYGLGLRLEEFEKVFERFYQVSGERHTAPGLGIGLYVCREIIRMHGGEILATSEGLGKGSTFSFTLPVAKEETDESDATVLDRAA